MKRIFIVFGLLFCFALPAQIASAYSFNSGLSFKDNIEALATEAGGSVVSMGTEWVGPYDLLQICGPYNTNILGGDLVAEGFSIVQGVDTGSFKLTDPFTGKVYLQAAIVGAYMVRDTTGAAYESNGNTLPIYNASIFLSVTTAAGTFVMLATPPGVYTPSSVPVPAAVWLMGTGLAGLVALRRRNK